MNGILVTLISFTINFQDRVNDVPWHFTDLRSVSITINSINLRFAIEVDRLFQNFSGPIYIFAEADNNRSTGWDNTGNISEDEFPLDGADIMIIVNHMLPEKSAIYILNSDESYSYLNRINCQIQRFNDTRTTITLTIQRSILNNIFKIKLFVGEEGNLGDAMPDNGFIEVESTLLMLD